MNNLKHSHESKHSQDCKIHEHEHHNHTSHDHSHHNHNHDDLFHHHGPATNNKKALIFALLITASIMTLEFVGGLITNSLALLSDSGHMLSDTISLALSLIAITFATKLATPQRTFGSQRYEILAALFNAVTLFVIAGIILFEAIERFTEPTAVSSGTMMAIAAIGLIANLLSMYVLSKKGDVEGSVNLKSAYLHVLGDALGSVGAIIAGIIMLLTDWYYADPIISVVVALIILRGAWRVLKQTMHILMEGTPSQIPFTDVETLLLSIANVTAVEQLHIWTITSNEHALTAHLTIPSHADEQTILHEATHLLKEKYTIAHLTIQIIVK